MYCTYSLKYGLTESRIPISWYANEGREEPRRKRSPIKDVSERMCVWNGAAHMRLQLASCSNRPWHLGANYCLLQLRRAKETKNEITNPTVAFAQKFFSPPYAFVWLIRLHDVIKRSCLEQVNVKDTFSVWCCLLQFEKTCHIVIYHHRILWLHNHAKKIRLPRKWNWRWKGYFLYLRMTGPHLITDFASEDRFRSTVAYRTEKKGYCYADNLD